MVGVLSNSVLSITVQRSKQLSVILQDEEKKSKRPQEEIGVPRIDMDCMKTERKELTKVAMEIGKFPPVSEVWILFIFFISNLMSLFFLLVTAFTIQGIASLKSVFWYLAVPSGISSLWGPFVS